MKENVTAARPHWLKTEKRYLYGIGMKHENKNLTSLVSKVQTVVGGV